MTTTYGNYKAYSSALERALDFVDSGPNAEIHKAAWRDYAKLIKPVSRSLNGGELHVKLSSARDCFDSKTIQVGVTEKQSGSIRDIGPVYDIPMFVYDISNSWISPWGVVLCDGRLYVDDFRSAAPKWRENGWPMWPSERIGFYAYDPETETCLVDTSAPAQTLDDSEVYFLFDSVESPINFAHFLHDTMSQLIAYDSISNKIGKKLVPIISGRFNFPIQTYIFETLIGNIERVIYMNRSPLRVSRCFTASRAMRGWEGEISSAGFKYLQERLQGLVIPSDDRKIYITRRDSPKNIRNFQNLLELEEILINEGFDFISASTLNTQEYFKVFGNCIRLLGIHGAGIFNSILSAKQNRVIELWEYPASYKSAKLVSWACDIDHSVVWALPPSDTGNLPQINISAVRAEILKS